MSGVADETRDAPGSRLPLRAVVPTWGDRVAAAASPVIGGPLGRHAVIGRRGWRPAAAVLSSLVSVFVALGVLQKNHCVSKGWAPPGSLWRACYSDLPVAVSAPRASGSMPWSDPTSSGQPPLTALLTWLVRSLVPSGSQLRLQQGMFAWSAVVIALLMALAVCLTAAALPRGPWTAAHVALSPVVVTASLISFEALGVMLVCAGFFAWYRHRYTLAGVLTACAFLARPVLGVAFVACLIVALAHGRSVHARKVLVGGVVALVVVVGAVLLTGADPFANLTTWRQSGLGYGSVWYVLSFADFSFSSGVLTTIGLFGWVVAIALGWLLVSGDKRLDVAPVGLLMLVVVLLTSRTVPVQAGLWALPFLAFSAVKWRDHLVWVGAEVLYFALVWSYVARDSNPGKALPQGWYAALVCVRLLAWGFLLRACVMAASDDGLRDGGEADGRDAGADVTTPASTDFVGPVRTR